MDYTKMKLDFASICRICLEDGGEHGIFESDDNMLLADKIMLCSSVQITKDDDFPSRICSVCNSMLSIALDFRNKCELSDTTLRNYTITKTVYVKDDYDNESDNGDFNNVDYVMNMEYNTSDYNYNIPQVDVDLKPKIELDDEDDLPLLNFRLDTKSYHKKEKKKHKKKLIRDEQKIAKSKVQKNSNGIANSILEGMFKWEENAWRHVKTPKINASPDKEGIDDDDTTEPSVVRLSSKILRAKQREINKALKLKLKKDKQKVATPSLCDHCGEQFNSKWRLTFHIRHKHQNAKVILKCTFSGCKKTFNSNYYRSRHEKRIHSGSKDFVCSQCGGQFAFKNELLTHTKKHDPVRYPKKLRKCKYCPQTYKTQKSTDIHERSVHTGERPAICTICEAAFFHEDYLKEHTRLHTGETPFKCPICGRGYAQRGNMKSHLRIHKISELDEKTRLKMRPNYLKLLRD